VGFALTPVAETLGTTPQLPYLCIASGGGGTVHIFRWVRSAGFDLFVLGFVLHDQKNSIILSGADYHRYASSNDICPQLTWAD